MALLDWVYKVSVKWIAFILYVMLAPFILMVSCWVSGVSHQTVCSKLLKKLLEDLIFQKSLLMYIV